MKIDALCNVGMNQVAIFYNSENDQTELTHLGVWSWRSKSWN
jgi:hypothetical protein